MTYEESLDIAIEERRTDSPDKYPSFGWKEFDETLWLLTGWQIYVVGGITGTGKSTFISQICQNISQQWHRVAIYSLEDRQETVRKNEMYFTINRILKSKWKPYITKWKYMAWEYVGIPEEKEAIKILKEKNKNIVFLHHNNDVNIRVIEEMVKESVKNGSKVIAIDHLHFFDSSDRVESDRHDLVLKDIMHRLNTLARDNKITIILVAHYRKLSPKEKPTLNEFSGSISIAQVANAVIHIWRDKWNDFWNTPDKNKTEFIIDKNRDMWITKTIEWDFNLLDYEYKFELSEKQIKRI